MFANFPAYLSTHSWIFVAAAVWTIPWKGVALWRAARNRSHIWFIVLLIVNTLGILEIIYIFFFSRKKSAPQAYTSDGSNNYDRKVLDIKR